MHVAIAPLIGFLCVLSENSHSSEILFPSFRRLKASVITSAAFKYLPVQSADDDMFNGWFDSVGCVGGLDRAFVQPTHHFLLIDFGVNLIEKHFKMLCNSLYRIPTYHPTGSRN